MNIKDQLDPITPLLGFDSYDEVKKYHKRWAYDFLGNGNNIRDAKARRKGDRRIILVSRILQRPVKKMIREGAASHDYTGSNDNCSGLKNVFVWSNDI